MVDERKNDESQCAVCIIGDNGIFDMVTHLLCGAWKHSEFYVGIEIQKDACVIGEHGRCIDGITVDGQLPLQMAVERDFGCTVDRHFTAF